MPSTRSADVARVLVDADLPHMDRPLDYICRLAQDALSWDPQCVRLSARIDGWIAERTRREVGEGSTSIESVVSSTPCLCH